MQKQKKALYLHKIEFQKIMKKYIFLLIFIFVASNLFAQNRGFKPVKVKVAGNQTTLYKQSHALVIGNSEYIYWNRLDGVKNDVQKVKTALEGNGFNVIVKENLTKIQMITEIDNFLSEYGYDKNNRVLIYYAGHGHTLDNNNSKMGYVVPIDAPMPNKDKRGFTNKALPMTQFKTWSESATFCKHSLFIFDACFAGSIFSSRGNPTTNEVINYNTTEFVRQFIASGSENETVPDQSVFCTQFVYALKSDVADMNNDGYMTGTELGEYLKNTVIQYRKNRQHPQYGKLDNPSFDKGDFVFVVDNDNNNDNETTQETTNTETKKTSEQIVINSNPIGAKIKIDNKVLGTTPFKTTLMFGTYQLELRKKGYNNFSKNLNIIEGQTDYNFTLNKISLAKMEYKKYNRRRNYTFFSMLGTAGLGVGFLLSANSLYNDYQIATTEATNLHNQIKNRDIIAISLFTLSATMTIPIGIYNKKRKIAKNKMNLY